MSDDRLADIKEHLAFGSSGVLWYDDDCIGDIDWLVGEVERLCEQEALAIELGDLLPKAFLERDRLRGLLARLEWASDADGCKWCPACQRRYCFGDPEHAPGCWLAAELHQ